MKWNIRIDTFQWKDYISSEEKIEEVKCEESDYKDSTSFLWSHWWIRDISIKNWQKK